MKQIIEYRQAGIRLKVLDSLVKVFSDEEPTCADEFWEIQALRGECVSFQIAYTCSDFEREDSRRFHFGFARVRVVSPIGAYVHVRGVCNVPCQYPVHAGVDENYLRKAPGLYPDRLEELREDSVIFQAGWWKSLWVDVEVPGEAEPGDYPVTILFEHPESGKRIGSVETEVTILPPVLPSQRFARTEWFYADCLADYYEVPVFSQEHWRIMENFIGAAAKRGINMILTPQFTPPLDTAVGKERTTVQLVGVEVTESGYSFDFSKLIRWVEMCKRQGIMYFEMSHLFSQWGAVSAPKVVGKKDGREVALFGWNTPAVGGEYTIFLHAYLPKLRQVLRELGVEENTYFHISDEPEPGQLASYRAARESVAQDLEGCRFLEALSDYEFYRLGVVDRPVCATNHVKPFLRGGVSELWTYYCTGQAVDVSNCFIAMPSDRTRIYGVQLFKFGIKGCLHWGYNFYNSMESIYRIDPFQVTDCGGAFPSGDAFLVYPGKDGKPEESIRMMVLDEAMGDLRSLLRLSELVGREKVLEMVEEGLETPLDFDAFPAYPRAADYLLRLRRKVNRAICEAEAGGPKEA